MRPYVHVLCGGEWWKYYFQKTADVKKEKYNTKKIYSV